MGDSVADLIEELAEANTDYQTAEQRVRAAQAEEVNALNRLNKAQKAFDHMTQKMRASAPRRSDWAGDEYVPFDPPQEGESDAAD